MKIKINNLLNSSIDYLLFGLIAYAMIIFSSLTIHAQKRAEVLEVHLKPQKVEYKSGCPVKITFSGTITIKKDSGTGSVGYNFVRSDGAATSEPKEIIFGFYETVKQFETSWTLGKSYQGWIKALAKGEGNMQDVSSTEREGSFSLTCISRAQPPKIGQ